MHCTTQNPDACSCHKLKKVDNIARVVRQCRHDINRLFGFFPHSGTKWDKHLNTVYLYEVQTFDYLACCDWLSLSSIEFNRCGILWKTTGFSMQGGLGIVGFTKTTQERCHLLFLGAHDCLPRMQAKTVPRTTLDTSMNISYMSSHCLRRLLVTTNNACTLESAKIGRNFQYTSDQEVMKNDRYLHPSSQMQFRRLSCSIPCLRPIASSSSGFWLSSLGSASDK